MACRCLENTNRPLAISSIALRPPGMSKIGAVLETLDLSRMTKKTEDSWAQSGCDGQPTNQTRRRSLH